MMLLELSFIFFVLVGSKIVIGLVAIYMLLPREPTCAVCDAETLPLEHPHGTGRLLRLLRLQRRWCMECGTGCLARASARGTVRRPAVPVAEPRLR